MTWAGYLIRVSATILQLDMNGASRCKSAAFSIITAWTVTFFPPVCCNHHNVATISSRCYNIIAKTATLVVEDD